MINQKKINYLYFLLIPLLLSFHFDLITADKLLMRDDVMLVSAVDTTNSLYDYFGKLVSGYYWDIQPIRDFTFWINLKLYHAFGFGGFHLINVLLGYLILLLVRKNLRLLKFDELLVFVGVMILAAHPLFNTTVAWVSNRKHLLSILFILMYCKEALQPEPKEWKTYVWALLSFLSQPITIFIPVLYVCYQKHFEKKKLTRWDILAFITSGTVLIANYWFYHHLPQFYFRNTFDSLNIATGLYVLKLCRVAFQIIFPVSLAVEYDPGSVLNIIGICLTVLSGFCVYKIRFNLKRTMIYFIILTSLFPVIKWGVRDPYLILTLILSVYIYLDFISGLSSKKIIVVSLFCFLFFSFYSVKFTNMWRDDETLLRMSYENEGGAENLTKYAFYMLKNNPEKAYVLFNEIIQNYPNIVQPVVMAARSEALFYFRTLTDAEKLKKFREESHPDIFSVFFEAKLLKKLGEIEKYDNATKSLLQALELNQTKQIFRSVICRNYKDDCKSLGL